MSKGNKTSNEAAFKKAVYDYNREKYSVELEKMFQLCFGDSRLENKFQEEFVLDLVEIIGGYKRRINDKDYFNRLRTCRAELSQLAALLQSSVEKLGLLDPNHNNALIVALERIDPNAPKTDFIGLLSQLINAGKLALRLDAALLVIAGYDLQKGRGNSHLPYLFPTVELIEFWVRWTGKIVPFAKGHKAHKDKPAEPDTAASEFVRLGLKMIDPNATSANAITSINSAREFIKLTNETVARVVGHPDPFREVLRIIEEENLAAAKAKKV